MSDTETSAAGEMDPEREQGLALAEEVIKAYGGLELWNRLQAIRVRLAFGGFGFRAKLLKVPVRGEMLVERTGQRVTFQPYPGPDRRGVFEGSRVRIESLDGTVFCERSQPRLAFRDFRHLFWWDALDLLYFAGQAGWTYFCVPFVLKDPGYELREGDPFRDSDETWRRLHVKFPAGIHTHCREQVFYIDDRGLIRRHDYIAEPFGSLAKAAHYPSEYRDFGGMVVPTRRRVYPRRVDGRPRRHPILVWIDVEDVTLVGQTN